MTQIHPSKETQMNKKINGINEETKNLLNNPESFVDKSELNLWKRGFTPQAEIWNGRMATVGIGCILILITIINKLAS